MITNLTSLTSSLSLQIGDNGMLLCMRHTCKDEGMSTHSSILAWRILCVEEPGRLQSTGSQKDTTEVTCHTYTCMYTGSSTVPRIIKRLRSGKCYCYFCCYSIEIWWHYRLFGHCLSNNGNWFRFWSSFLNGELRAMVTNPSVGGGMKWLVLSLLVRSSVPQLTAVALKMCSVGFPQDPFLWSAGQKFNMLFAFSLPFSHEWSFPEATWYMISHQIKQRSKSENPAILY